MLANLATIGQDLYRIAAIESSINVKPDTGLATLNIQ
jgi:hypothetical protein